MRRALLVLVSVLSIGLLAAGCSSSPAGSSTVSTVSAPEFASVVQRSGTQVVDVRTPAEFATGHLPGAVNLDVSAPGFSEQVAALDPAGTYAVYCRSGNRSQSATAQMLEAGLATVYELDGGILTWTAAGYPLV